MEITNQKTLNPWISMLFKPRETIQQITAAAPNHYHFILLTVLATLPLGIMEGINLIIYDEINLPYLFGGSILGLILFVTIIPVLMLYIIAYIIYISGKFLKGQASYQDVIAATAWSYIPYLWFSLFFYIQMIFLGPDLFQNYAQVSAQFKIYETIDNISIVWVLIISIFTLCQVQNFSIGKALCNLIFPFVIILGFLMIAGLIFGYYSF